MLFKTHLFSKLFSLFLTIFISLIPIGANADQRKVAVGAGVTNNTGKDKTDFHVKISSDTNMDVTSAGLKDPNGSTIDGAVTGNNSTMFTVDWNVDVNRGQKITWGAVFTQEEKNKYDIKEAFFTPKESPTDVPLLGWRVEANGDVFLTNGLRAGIDYKDLLFQFPAQFTTDSILDLVDAPLAGTPGLVSAGTVPAGSQAAPGELFVAQFSFLNPGDSLTARLDTNFTDPNFSPLVSTEVLGHVHQVPEPSIAAFLIIGLVVVVSLAKKKEAAVLQI